MSAVTSLRNNANGLARQVTDKGLGWWGLLPPVSHQGDRWWLPLSDVATVTLGYAISIADDSSCQFDDVSLARIIRGLKSDPPLFYYALLSWPGEELAEISDLAIWLIESSLDRFAAGDWLLAAPTVDHRQEREWSRLMVQTLSIAPERWLERAELWLRVLGPAVDPQWSATWPEVRWGSEDDATPVCSGSTLLQRLARSRSGELQLRRNLDGLAEKQKRDAAKQLAYGLSHEINNPLTNISARAQQLQIDEADPKRAAALGKIVEQVYRAHEMIAGLMFFANPPELEVGEVDLIELVSDAVESFRGTAEESEIRLMLELPDSPASANLDRLMMLEAVRVLIRNAIEAIGTGGTVVVSLDEERIDLDSAVWRIHVADSGPGLTPEASRHAFDPYYSGREAGRGLGLGLCRAFRVAELHGATVRISGGLAGCVASIEIPQ